jgi:hypothetical protein
MARITLKHSGLALVALVLALLPTLPVAAQTVPDKHPEVVYNGEVFDGQGYSGLFYPAEEHTIYVLAGSQSVFIPKRTQVYWWPITHEYKADWDSLNEPLTGTLEIGDQSLPLTVYSLRYDGGYDSAKTTLLVGDAAAQAYSDYQKALSDYQAASARYAELRAQYDVLLEVWGKAVDERKAKGQATDDLPVPKQPVEPTQPTVTLTTPTPGIAFSLPSGAYDLRLRGPDGQIVPGSERRLVAFGPRREGLAYKVIAESKWTIPDASTDPNDTIFVSGEKALYVQPAAEREYDSFYAAQLLNPQQRTVQDRRGIWSWLPSGAFSGKALEARAGGTAPQAIPQVQYYVKQTPGSALGYEILPYDASAGAGVATCAAFAVHPQSGSLTIAAPGVPGSSREIRVVNTGAGNLLLGLAFLPLIGGLFWLSYRRWRTR